MLRPEVQQLVGIMFETRQTAAELLPWQQENEEVAYAMLRGDRGEEVVQVTRESTFYVQIKHDTRNWTNVV